jgi:NADP-dependent 3-hydroxy acid dehydrogenase YdfG
LPPPPDHRRHALSDPRPILITGASSGFGAALTRAYAAPGRTLVMAGRDGTRLEGAAARCRLICKLRRLANAGSDLAASQVF